MTGETQEQSATKEEKRAEQPAAADKKPAVRKAKGTAAAAKPAAKKPAAKKPAAKKAKGTAKKAKGPAAKREGGIGSFCEALLRQKKSTEEILKAVRAKFPDAKTSPASLAWYRNKMREEGTLPKA